MTDTDHATSPLNVAHQEGAMRDAFASNSYWGDTALQDRVRASLASGGEQATKPGTAVVPAGPVSSLSPESMLKGRQLEAMMADKSSAYWKGDEHRSAEQYQAFYRDLIEAEARGDDLPSGQKYEGVDRDVPSKRGGYDYTGLPIHDGETRDLVDEFAGHALDAGFGTERVRDVLAWALNQPAGTTEQQFRSWALQRGWSTTHIKHAVEAYREMKKSFR
jgi:hypothetical protein